MNFKEYYVKHPEEIDYVDFYVVKDFGKMALTPKNALLLEKGTGRSAESWMNLFTNYTVYQERIKK